MHYDFGDIVLVRYPYTNQVDSKKRPAVVVSQAAYNLALPDVVLMPVTSQIRIPLRHGELLIQEWPAAGLLRASVVKPVFATIEKTLITGSLGKLGEADRNALKLAVRTLLG
jgi:mRNA interferase MazF